MLNYVKRNYLDASKKSKYSDQLDMIIFLIPLFVLGARLIMGGAVDHNIGNKWEKVHMTRDGRNGRIEVTYVGGDQSMSLPDIFSTNETNQFSFGVMFPW